MAATEAVNNHINGLGDDKTEIKKKTAYANASKAHEATDDSGRNSFYDDWAHKYDEELNMERYKGPRYVAEYTTIHLKGELDSRILDVAAGTGIMAEHLRVWGYQNCDALDASQGMLEKAKSKDLYMNYYCDLLGANKNIPDDTYDALGSAGGFGPSHIPCSAIPEMIRLVKPGGIVCLGIRTEFLESVKEYKNRLQPLFVELEAAGRWRLKEKVAVPEWFLDFPGIVWIYEVTCSGLPYTPLRILDSDRVIM